MSLALNQSFAGPESLGQWDFIASVIPQLISAGGAIASSSIQANAQKSIAAANNTALALREKIAAAQMSMQSNTQGINISSSNIGGIPPIYIIGGLIIAGLFLLRK